MYINGSVLKILNNQQVLVNQSTVLCISPRFERVHFTNWELTKLEEVETIHMKEVHLERLFKDGQNLRFAELQLHQNQRILNRYNPRPANLLFWETRQYTFPDKQVPINILYLDGSPSLNLLHLIIQYQCKFNVVNEYSEYPEDDFFETILLDKIEKLQDNSTDLFEYLRKLQIVF